MNYKPMISRPKTKRGRETLNRIVSAAAQVFYENGYHNSSINDITRMAGVASGTFYVYFEGKEDLYRFLLVQCSHMIRKFLNQSTKDCKSRREVEEVGFREWLKFVQENPYMYHIIWESLYIDKRLFVDYYETFCEAYMKGIDAAKANGEIRPEIDSEVLAYTLMGASNFLGLNWGLFKNDPSANDSVVESVMRIIDGGIFTEKGMANLQGGPRRATPTPIRIEVEFQDDGEEDEEEGDEADMTEVAEGR